MPRINYEIPQEIHRRAKVAAAQEGVTLRDFLLSALEAAVERAERDRKR